MPSDSQDAPVNNISTLRDELFATVRALRDPTNPMDIERAKAVAQVGAVIIDSAKAEVAMINALGRNKVAPTGFIGSTPGDTLDRQARALEGAPQATPGRGLPPGGPRGAL